MRLRCIYLWICAQSAMSFLAQSRHPECPLPIDEMNIISFVCATMTMIIEIEKEREKEHFTFYRLTECSASAFVELHGAKWRIWQKGREYFALSNIYYIYSINGEIFMCLSFMSIVALVYGNIISSISTKYLCSMIVSGWKRQIRPVKCRLPIVWRYFIPDGLRWLAIGKMRN